MHKIILFVLLALSVSACKTKDKVKTTDKVVVNTTPPVEIAPEDKTIYPTTQVDEKAFYGTWTIESFDYESNASIEKPIKITMKELSSITLFYDGRTFEGRWSFDYTRGIYEFTIPDGLCFMGVYEFKSAKQLKIGGTIQEGSLKNINATLMLSK
jgi:hypothetical protein